MNLWCKATNEVVSYKFVDSKDAANIVCDYTEYKELVSSRHELGIDGICESMYRSKDNYRGPTSIVVLVKDRPIQPIIRSKEIVAGCCVHELGHALGMEHSTNRNDAMFPASIVHKVPLTQRDIVTIRKIYPELRTAGNAEMH